MAANQEQPRLKAAAALLLAARSGTLATIHAGVPHASLVTPALDADGQPVLLLSALAAHTRHLAANPACALLVQGAAQDVAQGVAQDGNPQTTPRLCLTGTARIIPAEGIREHYLKWHPYAARYAGFRDFSFWKITVSTSQYIGGFANAGFLDFAALQQEISALLPHSYG